MPVLVKVREDLIWNAGRINKRSPVVGDRASSLVLWLCVSGESLDTCFFETVLQIS